MLRRRLPLIATALVAVLVLAAVAWFVRPLVVRDDRAVEAARRYADLLARGDADAAAEVWAMTVTDQPGALREASRLLPGATEHLEVVSVGGAAEADLGPVSYDLDLVDPTSVEVRYRLAGEEHTGSVVLARPSDLTGTGVGDWVVVAPLTGSVDWQAPQLADPATDAYVAGTRVVRRPGYLGASTDEQVQPLYPATYPVQRRLDPWFASADLEATVVAGKDPVAPPEARLAPTPKAQAWLRRSVLERIRGCGSPAEPCPAEDLAEDRGVRPYASDDWWRGLVRAPSVEVGVDGITISGGVLRLAGPRGVEDVPFDGTARTVVDNQSWNVYPTDIVLEEARS